MIRHSSDFIERRFGFFFDPIIIDLDYSVGLKNKSHKKIVAFLKVTFFTVIVKTK